VNSWARARGTPALEITVMTSSGHVTSSVASPFDSAWPLSYRLPIVNHPLSPVVSEIIVTHTNQTPAKYTAQPLDGEWLGNNVIMSLLGYSYSVLR